jgi:hypothetical protein
LRAQTAEKTPTLKLTLMPHNPPFATGGKVVLATVEQRNRDVRSTAASASIH